MKISCLTILVAIVLWPVSIGLAQKTDEGPVGIFPSRAEYNQFMGDAKRAAYGENGDPELQAMIPMLNDLVLNQPVGETANKYGAEASTLGMLSDPNVRADLEMVDDQYNDLKRLNSEIQQRAAEQLRGLDFNETAKVLEQIRRIREQAQTELNAVLLPHQRERLRQIGMQSQLRRRSLVEILTTDPVKTNLKITDRQADELQEAEKEIEVDLAKEIARLRERARARLLAPLNPSQKAEVEEMIGDAFEFDDSSKQVQRGQDQKSRAKDERVQGKIKGN